MCCSAKPVTQLQQRRTGMASAGTASGYTLMNKDEMVLDFECRRNAFDEPEFFELRWHVDYRPIGYRNLALFLEQRKAPKYRRHIKELLELYGCHDLEGFISVTLALSLGDTFWVRPESASLHWRSVSLYTNEFNELISNAAFDGTFTEMGLSSTSPEFGTDGYYAKCWSREHDGIYLYKSGSALYEIEPLSEFLASQVAAIICPDSVSYDIAYYHGKLISKCELFTNESVGLAKASSLISGEQTIPVLMQYFDSIGSGEQFRRMCLLDALIFNPDRHYGNFGVLFDTSNTKVLRMAPAFDHNRSLFPDLDIEQLSKPDWYLKKCRPRLGTDFVLTARNLLTDEIRMDLAKLKDFCFAQHDSIAAEKERIDALSAIIREQAAIILSN